MLKILKWSYNMGRRTERERIHSLAVSFINDARLSNRNFDIEERLFRNSGDSEKAKLESLKRQKLQVELDNAVADVLNRLIYPDSHDFVPNPAPIERDEIQV